MKTNPFTVLALAALLLAGCGTASNPTPEAQTTTQPTTDDVVTQLMMSRRSIRSYKDSAISRQTLDDILTCGVNAPNPTSTPKTFFNKFSARFRPSILATY